MKLYYPLDELEQCKADAKAASAEQGCVFHVARCGTDQGEVYLISDWHDSATNVVSYCDGEEL